MPPNSPPPVRRPWSWQKRVFTTGLLSGIILISSLAIGSLVYGFGRLTGLFKSQNLVTAVTAEVLKNPLLVDRFYHALDEQICRNPDLKFGLTVIKPLRVTPASGLNICTELVLTGPSGSPEYIKIQKTAQPAATALASALSGLTKVQTDTFNHPHYPATVVHAFKGATPMMLVLIVPDPSSSWSLVYYPADPVGERIFEKLAKSFFVGDNQ